MMHWSNDNDIYNDMVELSTYYNPLAPEPSPEPSEIKKRLCGKPSVYEMDNQEDDIPQEQFSAILPVRGHPLMQNGIRKPGGRPTVPNHQHFQTTKNIREVSGFGYGNDLIEHAFKQSNSEDERDPEKMKNLSFGFSSPQKNNENNYKKSGNESDSSTSTSSEFMSYSSRSNSSNCINHPDINNKKEFPDLK